MLSRSFGPVLLLSVGALAACGGNDDNKPTDAAIDSAPADASCTNYQGEIIDWNANSTSFCGVFQATATVRGQTSITGQSNPNGRFTLCLAPATTSVTVDITPPTDASQCASAPGKYTQSSVLVLQPSVIAKPTLASVRLISDSELTAMEAKIGQSTQTDRGQIVVHIEGTPTPATLSGINPANCSAATLQFNGTAWERVDQSKSPGTDIYFPDCMLTVVNNQPVSTTASVSLTDGRSVQLMVEPGKFTYVTIPAT